MAIDYQPLIDRLDEWIVERSGRVVAVFLVLTVVFTLGLGGVSTETGTDQFAEEVPEQEALDQVNAQFEPAFEPAEGTTQLIQRGENAVGKPGMLRMLAAIERLEDRPGLRIASTTSAAGVVASTLDPGARTTGEQRRAIERSTPGEIRAAVGTAAARDPGFARLLSEDFNSREGYASATVVVVRHDLPGADADAGRGSGESPLTPIQREMVSVVDTVGGDIVVFGAGTVAEEFSSVIGDTLLIVVPAAVLVITLFLVLAYRDLVDLLLGITSLGMAIVWTFGFMGIVGIPFNQILIAVPPLLLAVGIDFGIHAINRFREERTEGYDRPVAMRRATDQLLVAFFIVTTTTAIGFAANLTSQLLPIRDFGAVASVGIVFTALIFGVFLPALKMYTDDLRERVPAIPTFSQAPMGTAGTRLGRVLGVGVTVARRAPAPFLLAVLLVSAGAGVYATGLDTTFSEEQFLPPEEVSPLYGELPEPFRPDTYTVTATINYLEDTFESGEGDSVVVYVEGPMERDAALEQLHRAGADPPETFVRDGRRAEEQSIVTVVQAYARQDPEFAELVRRNDRNGNGVPDRNLARVYDALFASSAGDLAREYLAEDRRSARVVYTVKGDASQAAVTVDTRAVAERFRDEATATGSIVVFQAIATLILESALVSLGLSLAGTSIFLVFIYAVLEGRPSLGVVNVVPIVVTVALVAATMRLLGYSLNAFTATVLAMTIGLGIDYSVHVVHRFTDEFESDRDLDAALTRTVLGTGGALAGSVLTTAFGIGVLVLAVFPAIGQFGVLTAISVLYAFLAAVLVLPSTLALWERYWNRRRSLDVDPAVAESV